MTLTVLPWGGRQRDKEITVTALIDTNANKLLAEQRVTCLGFRISFASDRFLNIARWLHTLLPCTCQRTTSRLPKLSHSLA